MGEEEEGAAAVLGPGSGEGERRGGRGLVLRGQRRGRSPGLRGQQCPRAKGQGTRRGTAVSPSKWAGDPGGGTAGLRFCCLHSSKPSWADQVEEEGGEDGE